MTIARRGPYRPSGVGAPSPVFAVYVQVVAASGSGSTKSFGAPAFAGIAWACATNVFLPAATASTVVTAAVSGPYTNSVPPGPGPTTYVSASFFDDCQPPQPPLYPSLDLPSPSRISRQRSPVSFWKVTRLHAAPPAVPEATVTGSVDLSEAEQPTTPTSATPNAITTAIVLHS